MTADELKAVAWLHARADWDTDVGDIARTLLAMLGKEQEGVEAARDGCGSEQRERVATPIPSSTPPQEGGRVRAAVELACNDIETLGLGRRDTVLRLRAALKAADVAQPDPKEERGAALRIAEIVEGYTDILSEATARKVASRIRAAFGPKEGRGT